MSTQFKEINETNIYFSKEIVPIINVNGVYFEEKDVLEFSSDDQENYNQFIKDIAPRPISDNSNTICLSGVINAMPPLVKDYDSLNLKIENFAPIKGIINNKENQLKSFGYRSGTRSAIIKAKILTKEELEKLKEKNKLENIWIIARHGNNVYIPDENGEIFLRLKGCSMWTQDTQNKYLFPYVYLRDCKCYRIDYDPKKKYIDVRGFMCCNSSARELNGIREVKPYFDKLGILVGNIPIGFWKYINLDNDPTPNIDKCVCIMETLGDKRVETHFICGAEKLIMDLINEKQCEEIVNFINDIFNTNKLNPPSINNSTFSRAEKLPLYDMGDNCFKKRYTFDIAMDNFDKIMNEHGFIDSKIIMDYIKKYEKLYTLFLIYTEIGYEAGRILSTFHRTGNNWGTFYNDDIRLIDSNAHGDNLIILEKNKVKKRYEKEKIYQFFSMVDFDQMVRPEIGVVEWDGKINRYPQLATEYFWVELECLGKDLGGIATERQYFLNIPKRDSPKGKYYDLLFILRDCLIYELMMAYIDPMRKRHFETDIDIDKMYELIEKCMSLTVGIEA